MPRFTLKTDDGDLVIETAIPREAATLRAQGFTETKAKTKAVKEADAGPAPVPADSGTTPEPAAKTTK